MGIIKIAKKILPAGLKLKWKLWRRAGFDIDANYHFSNKKLNGNIDKVFPFNLVETQPILFSTTLENKLNNLRIGASSLQHIILEPGEIFSFWKLIGNPSQKNGFAKSRSIINGKLEPETGGGLCQLSGLIYLLALKAGLKIIERHSHSLDIYDDADRFTPLGADATVAYGYKDLRFQNNTMHPVCFSFVVESQRLMAVLHSQLVFEPNIIYFDYEKNGPIIFVKTISNGAVLNTSQYKKMQPDD